MSLINIKAELQKSNKRMAELEERVKKLNQLIYNVSHVSFIAGACYNKSDFHNEATKFAESMHSTHKVSDV